MSQGHNHLNHAHGRPCLTPKYRKKALFGQIRRHLGTDSGSLLGARNARSRKGTCCPTMCIC
jgi:hypothetical protein